MESAQVLQKGSVLIKHNRLGKFSGLTLLFIVGFAVSIVYPTTVSLVKKHAPLALGAQATTVAVSAASILDVIFNAAFGSATEVFGYGKAMPALCVALALSTILMVFIIPRGNKQHARNR